MSDVESTPDEGEVVQSREEELGDIFDRANAEEAGPARDEQGRFAAKETEDRPVKDEEQPADGVDAGAAEDVTDQAAEPEVEPETALEPPASWSEAAKAGWSAIPRELQDEVLRREGDWQKTDGERAARLKGYEPIEAALAPVQQHLQLSGLDAGTYISQLVAADGMLKNPETQAQAIQWIVNQYGIDLSNQQAEPVDIDPAIAPFVQEINKLKQQVSGFVSSQQEQESLRTAAEIETFAKDHPHFEDVRQHMGALIQAGAAADMSTAYDMAVWANPATRAKIQAESSAEAEAKKKAEAEEKAAKARRISQTNLSTQGTAPGATPPQYKTRTDELSAIYDRVEGA